jgi:hypothetical protein
LYNILIDLGILMKVRSLIKFCLHENYIRIWVGKILSEMFPIKDGLKQRDTLLSLLYKLQIVPVGGFRQTRMG